MEYKVQYQEYLDQATAALDAACARFLPEGSDVCLILPAAHADPLLRLQLFHCAHCPVGIGHKGVATGQHPVRIQRCSQCRGMPQLHLFCIHTRFLLRLDSLLQLLQTA